MREAKAALRRMTDIESREALLALYAYWANPPARHRSQQRKSVKDDKEKSQSGLPARDTTCQNLTMIGRSLTFGFSKGTMMKR